MSGAAATQAAVKGRIPRTWPLFFARHGRFTAIQQRAIPPILDGRDTLVMASTATGKTEAVVAPLLERYWSRASRPAEHGLTILYLCPTRALVSDLFERLQPVLADSSVTIGVKTGDTGPLDTRRPPAILITTPESTDSLLTREPRLFASVQAVVVDEVHLFDNSARGDHVRCLLPRIERIRQYARPDSAPAQRVALSATVPDPQGVSRRYLREGVTVHAPGGRQIVADVRPLGDLGELVAGLAQRAAQKSLVFCNSRNVVEQTAAYLRRHLPHQAEVFVHYSNLDAQMRQEVESRFAGAAVAVCVCTSTLELGIDIGSVDDIVLVGAPHNLTSFLQRVGRGSRRRAETRVLCLPKSPGEWARFEALLALAQEQPVGAPPAYSFRPSALVQQIFSLIKQSPTGGVRQADVRRIAPAEVTDEEIGQVLRHLGLLRYLQPGRPGEWRPDSLLQELFDRHEIYSNIGAEVLAALAVDAFTGRVVAQAERLYDKGTVVLFGGKPMEVVWRERNRFGLAPARRKEIDEVLRLQRDYAAIPFNVAQSVGRSLGLRPGEMAALPADNGTWLYHFWGTVWGEWLAALLLAQGLEAESVNEYCLHVRPAMDRLPPWDGGLAEETAERLAASLAGRLEMGRFHGLLPPAVAIPATVRQLGLEAFKQQYQTAALAPAAAIGEQLGMLRR